MTDPPIPDGDVACERAADRLTIRASAAAAGWGAILPVAVGVAALWLLWIGHPDPAYAETNSPFVVVLLGGGLAFAFIAAGLYHCVPRTNTVTFDLQARRITRTFSWWHGRYRRTRVYDFADVDGIGLTDCGDDEYAPSVHLKTGSRIPLTIRHITEPGAQARIQARIVDDVSDATGLPRQPHPMIWKSFETRWAPSGRKR